MNVGDTPNRRTLVVTTLKIDPVGILSQPNSENTQLFGPVDRISWEIAKLLLKLSGSAKYCAYPYTVGCHKYEFFVFDVSNFELILTVL